MLASNNQRGTIKKNRAEVDFYLVFNLIIMVLTDLKSSHVCLSSWPGGCIDHVPKEVVKQRHVSKFNSYGDMYIDMLPPYL